MVALNVLQFTSSDYVVAAFCAVSLVGVLSWSVHVFKRARGAAALWKEYAGKIGVLTFSDVSSRDNVARRALALVLIDEPGYGRLSFVPMAVELIHRELDAGVRELRARSGQAVLIGLMGTAATLALELVGFSADAQADGARGLSSIVSHFGVLYGVNAGCVFSSLAIFELASYLRKEGDESCSQLEGALYSLSEGSQNVIAPAMLKALEHSAAEFRSMSEVLLRDQFLEIGRLLQEVKGVGGALSSIVQNTIETKERRQSSFEAFRAEETRKYETLVGHLDSGFRTLALPFVEGLPVLAKIDSTSAQLSTLCEQLLAAQLVPTTRQLLEAATRLNAASERLPGAVAESLDSSVERLERATLDGFSAGAAQGVRQLLEETRAHLAVTADALADLQKAYADSTRASMEARAEADAKLSAFLGAQFGDRLGAAILDLREQIGRLAAAMKASQAEAAQSVRSIERLVDSFPKAAAKELRSATASVVESLDDIVIGKIVETGASNVETLNAAIRDHADRLAEQAGSIQQAVTGTAARLVTVEGAVAEVRDGMSSESAVHRAEVARLHEIVIGLEEKVGEEQRATAAALDAHFQRVSELLAQGRAVPPSEATDALGRDEQVLS